MNGDALKRAMAGHTTVPVHAGQSGYGMNRNDSYKGDGFYGDSSFEMRRRSQVRRKGHKCDVSKATRNVSRGTLTALDNISPTSRRTDRSARLSTQTMGLPKPDKSRDGQIQRPYKGDLSADLTHL